MMPRLSVVAPYWLDRPPGEALQIAGEVERLGYGELWLGEMMTFDAASLAGAVAGATRSLTVTVGPLAVGLRSPAALAMLLGSLATIGGRPARLALGSSSQVVVESWHGREWTHNADRLVETADGVRQAAAGRIDLQGRVVRSVGFRPGIPLPEPHVTIAAFGPRSVEAAAAAADRAVVNLITPEAAGRIRGELDQHGAGATPLAAWVVAGRRSDPVRRQVAGAVARYLLAPGYAGVLRGAGFGDHIDEAAAGRPLAEISARIGWEELSSIGLFGSDDDIERDLGRWAAAGVAEVCLVPATADDSAGTRLLAGLAG